MTGSDDFQQEIDDEFLAPPGDVITEENDQDGDDDAWSLGQGFPDEHGAVRVWADESGELTKVRVSLRWKTRSPSLSASFGFAFLLLNSYFERGQDIYGPQDEHIIPQSNKQFSWETIMRHEQKLNALWTEFGQLGGPLATWEGQRQSASDFDDGVKVTLDVHGRPSSADFDPKWLASSATSSEIARGVLNCYRSAKRKWRPPTLELTERGRKWREISIVRNELFGMLRNGIV